MPITCATPLAVAVAAGVTAQAIRRFPRLRPFRYWLDGKRRRTTMFPCNRCLGQIPSRNECETYANRNRAVKWKEGDRAYFDTNVAYSVNQQNDWESTDPAFRLAKPGLNGCRPLPSGPVSASISARDVPHDRFHYWDISGPGCGIENIDLGLQATGGDRSTEAGGSYTFSSQNIYDEVKDTANDALTYVWLVCKRTRRRY